MNRNLVSPSNSSATPPVDDAPQWWGSEVDQALGDVDYDDDEPFEACLLPDDLIDPLYLDPVGDRRGEFVDGIVDEPSLDSSPAPDDDEMADVEDIFDIDDRDRITSLDDDRRQPFLRLVLVVGVVVAVGLAIIRLNPGEEQPAETGPGPDREAIADNAPAETEESQEAPVVQVTVPPDPEAEPTDEVAVSTPESTDGDAAPDSTDADQPAPFVANNGEAATATPAPSPQPAPDASAATAAPGGVAGPTGGVEPAPAGTPEVFQYYGNPQIALSLADTEAGGRSIGAVSLRIRFPRGGTLTGVRTFLIFRPGEAGSDSFYHKGDGGTVEFRLQADDGSSGHHPSGTVLARTGNLIGGPEIYKGSGPSDAIVGGDPGDDSNFRKFSFLQPVQVEANTWYHLVMYNTGNDPRNNFVSYDNLNAGDRGRRAAVPLFGDLDYGVAYERGGSWVDRDQHWAIADFHFADGSTHGNGYMEVGSVNGPDRASTYVSPDQSVRQRFTPPQDLVVTGAHIGAMHVGGDNRLSLRLVDSSGRELWKGAASGFPSGKPSGAATLVTAEFRGDDSVPKVTLRGGQEYFLEVASVGGTHTVSGLRDGGVKYDFSSRSTVTGHAELRSGGGAWVGWPLGHATRVRNEFDMSFYLATENCVGC